MTLRLSLLVLVFTIFIQNTQAQISQDTFSFHTCMKFWKTGEPVSAFPSMVRNCIFSVPFQFSISEPDADSSCWKVRYLPDTCSASTLVTMPVRNMEADGDNGITVADMVILYDHIVNNIPLSPLKYRLADVNQSNSITTLDFVEMRNVVLGVYSEIPNNEAWQVFTDTLGDYYSMVLNGPPTLDTLFFTAGKTGDIDGDADPDGQYQPGQDQPVALVAPNWSLAPGSVVYLPFAFDQDIVTDAFQFNLFLDTSKVEFDIVNPVPGINLGGAMNDLKPNARHFAFLNGIQYTNNQFTASDPFLYVVLQSKAHTTIEEVLTMNPDATHNLWIDEQRKTHPLTLQFETASGTVDADLPPDSKAVALPNPFTEYCYVQLELPEAQAVLVELFDSHGKLCYRQETPFGAGVAQLEIGQYLPRARGLYTYRLSAGSWSASGKVVRQ